MMKFRFLIIILFATLIVAPLVSSSKNELELDIQDNMESLLTGEAILESTIVASEPNDLQKAYSRTLPGIVKVIFYADVKYYLPRILHIKKLFHVVDRFNESENLYDFPDERFNNDDRPFKENEPLFFGTGFLINPEGYILTNSHLAYKNKTVLEDMKKEEVLENYFLGMRKRHKEEENYMEVGYLTDEIIYEYIDDHLLVNITEVKLKVIFGVDKSDKGMSAQEYDAELISREGGNWEDYGTENFTTILDWALLKIDGSNFPSLKIGDSDAISTGDSIIAIGFPGISEEDAVGEKNEVIELIIRKDTEPTITSGHVSNIKQEGDHKVFQIDAGISGGNSGGPLLNSQGEVVGINTYSYQKYAGGDYNYALRINDIIQKISGTTSLSQGQSDKLWEDGLKSYWSKSYRSSKKTFEKLKEIDQNHPYVDNILMSLENITTEMNIAADDDKKGNLTAVIITGLIVIIILLLILVAYLLLKRRKKRKKK